MIELSKRYIDDMFDVSEDAIRGAIRKVYGSELLIKYMQSPEDELRKNGFRTRHIGKIGELNVIEGAAAAAFAAAFAEDKIRYEQIAEEVYPRKEIIGVVIASGNNIEHRLLEQILNEKVDS